MSSGTSSSGFSVSFSELFGTSTGFFSAFSSALLGRDFCFSFLGPATKSGLISGLKGLC